MNVILTNELHQSLEEEHVFITEHYLVTLINSGLVDCNHGGIFRNWRDLRGPIQSTFPVPIRAGELDVIRLDPKLTN